MAIILETERLILREFTTGDAAFILELVNTPSWLQYIGDRKVRTIGEAEKYLLNGPIRTYQKYGFGFGLVLLKEGRIPIGMCGLTKRDSLDDVDIGFAFLPEYTGRGYAFEVASAVMAYGWNTLHLNRIVAITTPDNVRSQKLLEKIGLAFEKTIVFEGETLWSYSAAGPA